MGKPAYVHYQGPYSSLGFFWTYEKEWPVWARLLDMRKSDIHANVTDYVYDAMTKPKKTRGGRRGGQRPGSDSDDMIDVEKIAPVERSGGRRLQ